MNINTLVILLFLLISLFSFCFLILKTKFPKTEIDNIEYLSENDLKIILNQIKEKKVSSSIKFICSNLESRKNWEVADYTLAKRIIRDYFL